LSRKMNKKNSDYIIGFDLGTNSVGYAVADLDMKIVRAKGKRLWGSILFDMGETAANTRLLRGARRRYERRRERIRLLRTLVEKSVLSVDPAFFARLDNSFLLNVKNDGDFGRDNVYNLFDGDYTDADYYREYKTIYHLRKRLCEDESRADIRLVYLALHHLIKYRGNFLHDEERLQVGGAGIITQLEEIINGFGVYYSDADGEIGFAPDLDVNEFVGVLTGKARKREKRDVLLKMLSGNDYKKQATAIASLLLGYKGDLSDLVLVSDADEKPEKCVVSFDSADYDEKALAFPSLFGDELSDLIGKLYSVYCDLMLASIIGEGNRLVCDGMIERYEKNKKDVAALKSVLRADRETYKAFFDSDSAAKISFVNYFKPHVVGRKNAIGKLVKREEFYAEVKKVFSKFEDSEAKAYCLGRIEEDDFLIKLNSTRNAVIPYQLNLNELELILDNQGRYYPELSENREKIISLMTFRRPYSVGIINKNSRFSWVAEGDVKNERAYPWNFEAVVNYDSLSERFIRRMTTRCGIFKDEDVLPASSVTYQIYNVLNELANVRVGVNGGPERRLTVAEKQKAFLMFLDKATVTKKDVAALLFREFGLSDARISGLSDESGKFLSKMTSYRALKTAFGGNGCFSVANNRIETDYETYALFEKIIEVITVFSDKKIRKRIIAKYIPSLDERVVNALVGLNMKGWGRFSKKCLVGTDGANGLNVLETLYVTDMNFQQIINDETLGFKERFSQHDNKKLGRITYADVDGLYLSPSVKRSVWQAVKAAEEIVKVMGCEPRCIYIESTRSESDKKRTKTRAGIVTELYNAVKTDVAEYNDCLQRVKSEFKRLDEKKLDDEKVYLYLLQFGRSMYSGKTLDINNLSETCEVDHIVPRHYIKDDSLQNKVLVLKNENQEKSGTLAINKEIRDKMLGFWAFLKANKFIGKKKYENLIRPSYDEKICKGFIDRQLIETSQGLKAVRDLLKERFERCDIELVKAGISSAFRSQLSSEGYYDFFKLRELNDFHHAKDAYLAAVIGYFTRKIYPIWGTDSEARLLKDELYRTNGRSAAELCNRRNGIVVEMMQTVSSDVKDGCSDWNTRYNNILSAFANNDCLISRKKELDTGAFYNATIRSPREEKGCVPLRFAVDRRGEKRPLPPKLYGNYEGENNAFSYFVTYEKGKKRETVLMGLPVRIYYQSRNDEKMIESYYGEILAAENKKFISYDKRKILKYQLARINGQACYITSNSEIINAEQLLIDKKYALLLYCVAHPDKKVFFRGKDYRLTDNDESLTADMKDFFISYVEKLRARYPIYEKYADGILQYTSSQEFAALPVYARNGVSKVEYIERLLNLTRACSTCLDMKPFGGKTSWGRLNNKTIYAKTTLLTDTSVTGIYRKESVIGGTED